MTLKQNIQAVLDTCFTDTKDELHEIAIKNIMEIINNDRAATTNNMISKAEACEAIANETTIGSVDDLKEYVERNNLSEQWLGGIVTAINAIEDLPGKGDEPSFEQINDYCKKRNLVIVDKDMWLKYSPDRLRISEIFGYDITLLEFIATFLKKENLPPEKAAEVFKDIQRTIAVVRDETLKEILGQIQFVINQTDDQQD